jgi:hypothetical protein
MVQKANSVIPRRPWAMAYTLWDQVLAEGPVLGIVIEADVTLGWDSYVGPPMAVSTWIASALPLWVSS